MNNLFRTTDRNPFAAIMAGICLAVLHVVVTVALYFVAPDLLKGLNVFGILLGTVTLGIGLSFSNLNTFAKWMTILGIATFNVIMIVLSFGLDTFFGTNFVAYVLDGIAIIILCPLAFGYLIYNLPINESAEEAHSPASATVITIDSRSAVAWLRRFEYRLDLLLKEFAVTDDTDFVHPMSLDIVTMFLRVEHKLELLVSNFNAIDDRADDRFPKPDTN